MNLLKESIKYAHWYAPSDIVRYYHIPYVVNGNLDANTYAFGASMKQVSLDMFEWRIMPFPYNPFWITSREIVGEGIKGDALYKVFEYGWMNFNLRKKYELA